MSDHYEVVLSVFLAEETPVEVLDTIRWHMGLLKDRPEHMGPPEDPDFEWRYLDPDPDHPRLPGGEVARLQRQSVGSTADGVELHPWGLFYRGFFLDDDLNVPYEILDLVAPHIVTWGGVEFGGFIRDVSFDDDHKRIFVDGDGGYEVV